ncbi:RsiW-degrading membrane proteinase PrsW (M82 family) [Actinoplanes lutulentus]|uniref:Protease prsW family protein n=1 Tax=Actinoplanes lutulentus TaxID=1287878 RepID=A0A327Z2Y8_9ACTN|nr:PrsW family glutamic-type intramembrane protease [Actinoplanes lutulentus]MBB2947132.1 RsiW-degrading membrane proteinase PrsW (M82 family) [Actinoplanes lutulentus]RAK24662.1 protease prsW family protein [Actinoplanes lutulentus]
MTTLDTAAEDRAAALEASGWGEPFRLIQVRNLCFWVFAIGVAGGAYDLIQYFKPGLTPYGTGIGFGVAGFAIYTIPWLILLSYHNRYTRLPGKLLLAAAAWGAFAATFWVAITANGAILSIYGKLFGQAWASDWGAGLTAPFTEETSKALALILLIGLAPRLVRSPFDGLIIGAYAGLGFQIIEDILYAYNATIVAFGADQIGAAWQIVALRSLSGLFGHVLFSAIFCAGLMWLLGRGQGTHRLRGALLMIGAMLAHGFWDDMGALGYKLGGNIGISLLWFIVLPAVDLLLLWLAFRLAVPQEQAWLRAILAPETESGLLTDAEVAAAAGGWRARRAFRKAQQDHQARVRAKHILTAANDLAQELAGHDETRIAHARSEITRLRGTR